MADDRIEALVERCLLAAYEEWTDRWIAHCEETMAQALLINDGLTAEQILARDFLPPRLVDLKDC